MSFLVDLLTPPRCAACDALLRPGVVFCPSCAATLERAPRRASDLVAPLVYGGAVARAIARFKYEDRPDLARGLAAPIAREAASVRFDVVVPVPLHPARLVARGYNQSALLAREIARATGGAPVEMGALVRVRDTAAQASLGREGRARNVDGAFAMARGRAPRVAGARVMLVDDVRTTGATLEACASALRDAGATHVVCAVVAVANGV